MGASIFLIVMLVGAMPTNSWFYRTYKPIRGEMAIIGGMFVVIHNFIYGRKYFVMMWNDISKVKDYELIAACLTFAALCILLPLWITSFFTIRKRMKHETWVKLHKLAYVYYFLVYVHVMVLYGNILHIALTTGKYDRVNLLVFGICFYNIIYGIYAIGKFCKWKHGKKETLPA